MSYNLVDPTTGDLTRVAGNIDTSIIPNDASASNKLATEKDIQCFRTAQNDSYLWYAQQKFGCVAGTLYRVQLTLSSSSGAWMGIVIFNAVSQAGTFNPNTTTFVKCGGNIDIQGINAWGTILHDGGFVCAMMQMLDPM